MRSVSNVAALLTYLLIPLSCTDPGSDAPAGQLGGEALEGESERIAATRGSEEVRERAADPTSEEVVEKSPSEVVVAAYTAANQGKYSEVRDRYSESMQGQIDMFGGLQTHWDELTKDGAVTWITPLEEEIRGEGAQVLFSVVFQDGTTAIRENALLLEDGSWRLSDVAGIGQRTVLLQRYRTARNEVSRVVIDVWGAQRRYVTRHAVPALTLPQLDLSLPAHISVLLFVSGVPMPRSADPQRLREDLENSGLALGPDTPWTIRGDHTGLPYRLTCTRGHTGASPECNPHGQAELIAR